MGRGEARAPGQSSMPKSEQAVEHTGEDKDEGEEIAQKLEVAVQHLNFTGYSLWGAGQGI